MKRIDLAYMGGLFDGEGCICISKAVTQRGYRSPRYTLSVSINMANDYIPQLFRFAFGGSFNKIRRKRGNHQPNWQWQAVSRVARDFLVTIKPYLRLKRNEAELAIEFQNRKRAGSKKGNWGVEKHTSEVTAYEEAQAILLRKMKIKSQESSGV